MTGPFPPLTGYSSARKTANDLDHQAREALKATELTPPLFDMLLHLAQEGGRARILSLGATLGITSGGSTRLVDRGVRLGYVTRIQDETDHRVVYAAITQSGRAQYELALPLMLDSFTTGRTS